MSGMLICTCTISSSNDYPIKSDCNETTLTDRTYSKQRKYYYCIMPDFRIVDKLLRRKGESLEMILCPL